MYPTAEELMQRLGIPSLPERWLSFYDEVMKQVEQEGCPAATPAYYDELQATYNPFPKCLDVCKQAAAEVAANEDLVRLLALMCHALLDREHIIEEVKQFVCPTPPENASPLAYDMLTGLAMFTTIPVADRAMRERGMPEELITTTLQRYESGITEYAKRHNGVPGYSLWAWFQRIVDCRLFPIGRLEMEFHCKFANKGYVLQDRAGNRVTLANEQILREDGFACNSSEEELQPNVYTATVTETKYAWYGKAYREDGGVCAEEKCYPKTEWEALLSPGDDIISVHIPPAGSLTPELVEATIEETRQFAKTYFPELNIRAFICGSWLLDPVLEKMLGADSNIAKFGKRFVRMTRKSHGKAVFYFVFLKPSDAEICLDDLSENTRLERALKAYYKEGKQVNEFYGYFF